MNDLFDPQDYLADFQSFSQEVECTGRNPLNTEMFYLWCMIRATRPRLFIESGTFRGYSATFICEALRRNGDGAEFVTFGYNLEDCLPYARQRLAAYPFARVVEGDSRLGIRQFAGEQRATAFFIDGPKGRNMPALFRGILRHFTQVLFLAVHDCQPDSTSGNRQYLEGYFGPFFPIRYCESPFELAYRELDRTLEGCGDWRPYELNGQKTESYGTGTGYVLASQPFAIPPIHRALLRARRWVGYHVWLEAKNRARQALLPEVL